jgi:putative endonuclease
MYYVYVLENQVDKSLYIGYSADLRQRILDHNAGKGGKTTSAKRNWCIIYYESYLLQSDALGREKFLKVGSGRKYLYKQLANYFDKKV